MDYFLGQLIKQIPTATQILEKAVIDGNIINVIIEQNVSLLEGVVSMVADTSGKILLSTMVLWWRT